MDRLDQPLHAKRERDAPYGNSSGQHSAAHHNKRPRGAYGQGAAPQAASEAPEESEQRMLATAIVNGLKGVAQRTNEAEIQFQIDALARSLMHSIEQSEALARALIRCAVALTGQESAVAA